MIEKWLTLKKWRLRFNCSCFCVVIGSLSWKAHVLYHSKNIECSSGSHLARLITSTAICASWNPTSYVVRKTVMMVDTHSKMTLVPRPTCGMFEKSLEGSRLQHWNPYYSPSVFQLSAYFQSPSKTNVPSSCPLHSPTASLVASSCL